MLQKKFLLGAILTAAVCLNACANGGTEVTETSTGTAGEAASAETTKATKTTTSAKIAAETETVSQITFVNKEAENYYNIIMNDMSWCSDGLMAAAIIDVHGDGIPEFIIRNAADSRIGYGVTDAELCCYSFGEEKLEFMYSFEDIFSNMAKYDDGGKTKWFGFAETNDDWDDDYEEQGRSFYDLDHKSEATYGLFEFTESGPVLTDRLFYTVEEYDSKTDVFKRETYINGEHYDTDCAEGYSNGGGAFKAYRNWKNEIADWQRKNLTSEENYIIRKWEPFWADRVSGYDDMSTEDCVSERVNAYCRNDRDYLTGEVHIIDFNDLPCTD